MPILLSWLSIILLAGVSLLISIFVAPFLYRLRTVFILLNFVVVPLFPLCYNLIKILMEVVFMKKIIVSMVAAAIALSLAACSGGVFRFSRVAIEQRVRSAIR